MTETWIVVPRWEDFQHRDMARSTVPPWFKVYTELHSKTEFLDLSFHLRGVLLSIWIEYARSRRQLRGSMPAPRRDRARTLSALCRQLGGNVTTRDLERLKDAGFIQLSASNPASKVASNPASLEVEVEVEKEQEQPPTQPNPLAKGPAHTNGTSPDHRNETSGVAGLGGGMNLIGATIREQLDQLGGFDDDGLTPIDEEPF